MAVESVADRITIYADNWSEEDPLPDAEEVERLAMWMQSIVAEGAPLAAVQSLNTGSTAELITRSAAISAGSAVLSEEAAALSPAIFAAPAPQQTAFVADLAYELTLFVRLLHATTSPTSPKKWPEFKQSRTLVFFISTRHADFMAHIVNDATI